MKERQRWRPEEDALLCAYVKQYGPRDWHLVSERTNKPLNRDAKSCLERWKNYLKPGIKKGPLSEQEQRLVIHLQSKHGNKWKKIASEVPGRAAKRLGKWWEVFKEKQEREQRESNKKLLEPIEEGKYNQILETFTEKLVNSSLMATSNGGFLHTDPPATSAPTVIPPWLTTTVRPPPSPSVTLTLSNLTAAPGPTPIPWLQTTDRVVADNSPHGMLNIQPFSGIAPENRLISELAECCRELEEGQRAWAGHRKEAAWRLKRVELQLESEKACRRREKIEEIEAKVKALKEEQRVVLDKIEAEYREQLAGLRREAEVKEQKLGEQWAAKHNRLSKFLEQMGCRSIGGSEPNGR